MQTIANEENIKDLNFELHFSRTDKPEQFQDEGYCILILMVTSFIHAMIYQKKLFHLRLIKQNSRF